MHLWNMRSIRKSNLVPQKLTIAVESTFFHQKLMDLARQELSNSWVQKSANFMLENCIIFAPHPARMGALQIVNECGLFLQTNLG